MARWLGVDVGGRRKGFDVAVICGDRVIELARRLTRDDVVALAERHRPAVIGVDGPRSCAPDGATSREGERLLAASVCGIRWTPDAARVSAGGYYGWIVEGLALFRALAGYDGDVIEVFPTASWTRWHGARGTVRRSAWTRRALAGLGLRGVPERTNQDQRDAIAAGLTARQYAAGETEQFGEIVVPVSGIPGHGRMSSNVAVSVPSGSSSSRPSMCRRAGPSSVHSSRK
jgi:predicted nuclease with RNAse H fold